MSLQTEFHVPQGKGHRVALVALLLVCVFWGSTFPLMQLAMDAIHAHLPKGADGAALHPHAEPAVFLAIRFTLTAMLMPLLLVFVREPARQVSAGAEWGYSSVLAAIFTGSFYLQVYGLKEVDASLSAFITSLYVVFTPFFVWMLQRRRPAREVAVAIPIALFGVALFAYRPDVGVAAMLEDDGLLLGILLSLGCAIGFALHIAFTDVSTRKVPPLRLSVYMMLVASAVAFLALAAVIPYGDFFGMLPGLLADWDFLWPLLVTTVFATVIAVYFWNRWQKDLGPSRAAVLYTMEPVFATVIAMMMGRESLFLGDDLRVNLLVGAGLVIGANLGCELVGNWRQERKLARLHAAAKEVEKSGN